MDGVDQDALLLLRQSIVSQTASITPITSTDDASSASAPEASLAQATHLRFTDNGNSISLPIDVPTRFISNDSPVDLRSIYFAWLHRNEAIPEYNAAAAKLNDELSGAATVHKFAFVERLDLITWLESASGESEYIKPLAGEKDSAAAAAAASAALKGSAAPTSAQAKSGRGTLDPRLAQIYNGERRMGDRNTVLRGIKPTDFSHVRKLAATLMIKKPTPSSNPAPSQSLALNPKHAQRRPDPIILLSPSASSLLRMSNVKSFLEGGRYVPPDNSSTATMLHITRIMKEIDPARPMRFILVEGPEQFRPEYWNRVVAVFTTGQSWQFKNYKWSSATELFKHVLGIYVGWRGDEPPDSVRSYGKRIMTCQVDKWTGSEASRYRDREVVEGVWKAIEGNMRAKGWKRDTAPATI